MNRSMLVGSLVGSLFAALAIGCGPAYYVAVDNDPIVAPGPPPEERVEEPGPPPVAGAQWVPGYWYWTGEGYVWVAGAWSQPPAATFVWVRAGWVFIDGGYRFVPGRWAHPRRVPRYPYYRPPPRRGDRGPDHRPAPAHPPIHDHHP